LAAGLIPLHAVFALDPSQTVTQYAHTAWTQFGDAANNPVRAFEQTHDGYLWLGTGDAGLIRFDGRNFERWKAKAGQRLPGESIQALRSARDGSLWIGTRGGLARLKDGNLEEFTTRDGLSAGAVTAIAEDQNGGIWIGTYGYQSGGLSRFERGHLTKVAPSDGSEASGVSDIHSDRSGRFWIGRYEGLFLWDSQTLVAKRQTPSTEIVSIAENPDGSLWLASPRGLLKYSKAQVEAKALLPRGTDAKTYRVLVDRDGGLWIATLGQGLFHIGAGRIERMTRSDGLSSDRVLALFEDREGNIWVGTQNGIDRFREYKIAHWSTREGLPGDNVGAVLGEPDGNLCAGIETVGVYCFANGRTRRLPNSSIFAMFGDHDKKLEIATAGGIISLSPTGTSALSDRLNLVYLIAEDRDHRLWFGDIEQGLFSLQNGKLSQVAKDRFAGKPISFLLADRENRLWIALNPGPLTVYQSGVFRTFSHGDGLRSDQVVSVFEDHSGTIWVATDDGLSRYDNGRFATLTTREGLPCDSIQDILEDDLGFLWLRAGCGLIRAKRAELVAASTRAGGQIHSELFNLSDGFQASTLPRGTTPRAAKTSDGRLWFIAGEGVAAVDPRHIARNMVPPPVHLEQITVDGKAIDASRTASLPPTLSRLQFDYTALSFTDPDRVFFKYRLDGLDKDWVDAGTRRQAFYANLRPGRYQFQVIACNNDGVWNEMGATFSFNVESAFLQTRSFAWLCALAGMLFLNGIYYLRLHGTPALLLRNTIKSYPTGIPGLGLLLLRVAIGFDLLTRSTLFNPFANNLTSSWSDLPRLLEITGGLFLIAGFATPMVGALLTSVVVLEMIQRAAADPAYASLRGPWENALLCHRAQFADSARARSQFARCQTLRSAARFHNLPKYRRLILNSLSSSIVSSCHLLSSWIVLLVLADNSQRLSWYSSCNLTSAEGIDCHGPCLLGRSSCARFLPKRPAGSQAMCWIAPRRLFPEQG
jgi:ligand-binding sensor domain-containing protein